MDEKKDKEKKKLEVDQYADDSKLYSKQLSWDQRLEYLNFLSKREPKPEPPEVSSWIKQNELNSLEMEFRNFPALWHSRLTIITHRGWDYAYLIIFLIWLAVLGSALDELFSDMGFIPPVISALVSQPIIIGLPMIFMFLVQCVPVFGSMYLMHYCNDLVVCRARRDFENWSFTACLVCQSVEFFYYGGQMKSHLAGKVIGNKNTTSAGAELTPTTTLSLGQKVWSVLSYPKTLFLKFRSAKVHEYEVDDGEDDINNEEGDVELGSIEQGSAEPDAVDNDELMPLPTDINDQQIVPLETYPETNESDELELKDNKPEVDIELMDPNEFFRSKRRVLAPVIDAAAEEEKMLKKVQKLKDKMAADLKVTEWLEWRCIVCGRENRENKNPDPSFNINFGVRGVYFKSVYAIINHEPRVPRCIHCLTLANYEPPAGSAHIFVHNEQNRHKAFENYPVAPILHSGLRPDWISNISTRIGSFFFGIRNDHRYVSLIPFCVFISNRSLLLWPDWKTRLYVASQFPEVPRYSKEKHEYFVVGEICECKEQKVEWLRCKITAVHRNHTYDLQYLESGVDLRFAREEAIRFLPEKRTYAYQVEACIVWMVLAFPLFLLIAIASGLPSLFVLTILLPCGYLLSIRTIKFYRCLKIHMYAGILMLSGQYFLFAGTLWIMTIASLLVLLTSSYIFGSYVFILGLAAGACNLAMIKSSFAMLALPVFGQIAFALFMIPSALIGTPYFSYYLIIIAPLLSATLNVIGYRYFLNKLWDVCLTIRPLRSVREKIESKDSDESLLTRLYNCISTIWRTETCCGGVWDSVSDTLGGFRGK